MRGWLTDYVGEGSQWGGGQRDSRPKSEGGDHHRQNNAQAQHSNTGRHQTGLQDQRPQHMRKWDGGHPGPTIFMFGAVTGLELFNATATGI